MRYLRSKRSLQIFEWDEILASNPLCEEITEEQAYPERSIPAANKGRKARVDVATPVEDIPVEPSMSFPELEEQLTKDLAKKTS